jgi:D-glycero-D-manno-heptose 1,7-bisphosphate phosphatase
LRRALFLDRDGVLNIDHGYVYRPQDFEVIDGVFEALRRAQGLKFALIVVSNQSGIARGLFSADDYARLEEYMRGLFRKEGIEFTDIYHCPHHPDGQIAAFTRQCLCRKPLPGMFLQAAQDHAIDLTRSMMVGDKETDAQAARAAGVSAIHLVHFPQSRLLDVIASELDSTPNASRL